MNDVIPGWEEFLHQPTEEIRKIVGRKNRPYTGIFIADGNRRLVMAETGLMPQEESFYDSYVKIFTELFRENLSVFFEHGLNTLVFPLFGPSFLERDDMFRQQVVPELVRILFTDKKWLSFYDEYGIRVRTYGNVERLNWEYPEAGLEEVVKDGASHTADHPRHTIYYGFFSDCVFDGLFVSAVHRFMETHRREPTRQEWVQLYYGEPLCTADFLITSTGLGYLGALPPLLYGKDTLLYTLVAPAIFALNERTFREILYDMLFENNGAGNGHARASRNDIGELKSYYRKNQHKVLGISKKLGKFRVLDV